MEKYKFTLTPAYGRFKDASVRHQRGSRILFLVKDLQDEELLARLRDAFRRHLAFVRGTSDCPELFRRPERIVFKRKFSFLKKTGS